jgi:tRNA (guanine37-N1)-methyltransferase
VAIDNIDLHHKGETNRSMTQQPIEKAYALKVPKKQGEKAIRLAARLGLLDKNLKILPENSSLLIPLIQRPHLEHVDEISRGLNAFKIVVHEFVVQAKRPTSVFEIAADRLPPHLLASFPRAVDFVGEIAVVEIPPELAEYKNLVGESVLKAHRNVRTVLAKYGAVGGIYRLREYEVIAGLPDTETVHREHGCRYFLDLRKVYFSPRLCHEHYRIASQVKENETVIDMFAGVGPFSVLIATLRTNVRAYAVDVNPDAVRYLEKNAIANSVLGKVVPILGEIKKVVQERLRGTADRVIMNLPESAVEYADVACQALRPEGGIMHYYEFAEGLDVMETAKRHLMEAMGRTGRNIAGFLSARIVREVAPFKWQVVVDAIIR